MPLVRFGFVPRIPAARIPAALALAFAVVAGSLFAAPAPARAELALDGLSVVPHLKLDTMRYMREPEPPDGALVRMFLRNAGDEPIAAGPDARLLFDGRSPADLLASGDWAWHDTPVAPPGETLALPPGALTVWTFNGRRKPWGTGGEPRVAFGPEAAPWLAAPLAIVAPTEWISAATFLAPEGELLPDLIFVHVANALDEPLELRGCRLWLPAPGGSPFVLFPEPPLETVQWFGGRPAIGPGDKGGFLARRPDLPLAYCAIEVFARRPSGEPATLWAHLRIKPERFDVSGGWVNGGRNHVAREPFLKALKRLHANTAHLTAVPGYTDTELYDRYPLKYFGAMRPVEEYDRDDVLPRVHAVEFLGEPQYGGGRPVPPQEVWKELRPFARTRLATTVTHSEERIWRDYAGLSDFPHYDAYRVTAPSPDAWFKYDRWNGERIRWGAPLETIGDMCRSLRELNRPMPCAVWSQGPHAGWSRYGGRARTSPTPDEIRLQAYHALSTRVTSLYWFNLSLKTLVAWRDTLDELGRVGREMRMLDEFLLEGDAFRHERLARPDGAPDWDVATVAGPRAALLFALDLDYAPDPAEKVFRFGPPRAATWDFALPGYLRGTIRHAFRIDADGTHSLDWSETERGVRVADERNKVGVFVATPDPELRAAIEAEWRSLLEEERALDFDPARDDADFAELQKILAEE